MSLILKQMKNGFGLWRLKEGIDTPPGLTLCTDRGQAVMHGVSEVFPHAEHRECMWHLVQNFKKRFSGKKNL